MAELAMAADFMAKNPELVKTAQRTTSIAVMVVIALVLIFIGAMMNLGQSVDAKMIGWLFIVVGIAMPAVALWLQHRRGG